MKSYFVKTPQAIKVRYSKWLWNFSRDTRTIYLTFDDGPTPEITEWTLAQLKKFNAEATFFCIGKNVDAHKEIYHKIIQNGHAIGNHTYNHLKGWKSSSNLYLENVKKASEAMPEIAGIFRPPYGKITFNQARKIRKKGLKIIGWDVLSADFDKAITNEKCLKNVLDNTKSGSIVVFHDSLKASEKLYYVLPKILEHYSKKGYEFKKIAL